MSVLVLLLLLLVGGRDADPDDYVGVQAEVELALQVGELSCDVWCILNVFGSCGRASGGELSTTQKPAATHVPIRCGVPP